ncbi:hypothetical protein [Bathymodiolus japonicus methanotrophic gill symbiont]|uniref:hypothetical protein n=1 Tax=Bathymodiolus japonicus methanotrophic gill symbiont TaxID=113269 RepID=UPI001C8DAF38|nr:hypothetical protein [Bathymodiolus japonicus methanotrophic gill symbiont]
MAFYFVSTFANAQTPTKQRPYGYRGLKIITSLRLRFPDFQRLLVTSSITVPVGFFFYMPDPALKQWDKEDKRLKKSGIAKKDRPIKPERDSAYPTKTEIALGLLKEFKVAHSLIKIKGVLADALYGEKAFMDEAAKESGGSQVISQLRKNQNSGSRYFCESLFWASQPKQAAKT